MIVVVQGTKSFNDYAIFLRAMGTAMSSMPEDDNEFYIYSAGPAVVNKMVAEFSNVSERGMKARGKKIRFFRIPPKWVRENISIVDYLVYLSKPKEPLSDLVDLAESKDINVGVYRY